MPGIVACTLYLVPGTWYLVSLELGVSISILLSVVSTLILLCKLGSQGKGLCSSAGLHRLAPFFCEVIVLTTGAVGPDWVGAPARLLPHKEASFWLMYFPNCTFVFLQFLLYSAEYNYLVQIGLGLVRKNHKGIPVITSR